MPSIFVHVASYRDPECEHTINDLFRKASEPERISVGVVLQQMPEDNYHFHSSRLRAICIDARETQGACWARSLGYTLYRGEDYILQIDSHMRFTEGWDTSLLTELAACPSDKPMLTVYAPNYTPPNDLEQNCTNLLFAHSFEPNGNVRQSSHRLQERQYAPMPAALVSGAFMFARAQWISEVPYDPQLYFWGEEITLAVRLWTSGWDLFNPRQTFIWHQYNRYAAHRHWDDNEPWGRLNDRSLARVRSLLETEETGAGDAIDLGSYGLGAVRTLCEYEKYSGINFKLRTLTEDARAGRVVRGG